MAEQQDVHRKLDRPACRPLSVNESGKSTNVEWAATDPRSGQFSGIYVGSTFSELEDRLAALRLRGEGYFQIARQGSEYPYLILGFRDVRAVLYRMDTADTMLIHDGDGSVREDEEVDVLIMEEYNAVSGKYALALSFAWSIVRHFGDTGQMGQVSDWIRL